MNELKEYLEEDRRVCICRELTKTYESIEHTTIGDVSGEKLVAKGEFTLVIEGKREYSNRSAKTTLAVDEKAMKCMDALRAEGVSRAVIQRVMKEVFDVGVGGGLDVAFRVCGEEDLVSSKQLVCFRQTHELKTMFLATEARFASPQRDSTSWRANSVTVPGPWEVTKH